MSPRRPARYPTTLPPSSSVPGDLDERRADAFARAWDVLPNREVPTAVLLADYLSAVLDEL